MDQQKIMNQIIGGHQKAGKRYSFDETHDPRQPADFWFQQSTEGTVLFIVFYTQACRWSRCLGCNLPARMSREHVNYQLIMDQIDTLFRHPDVAGRLSEIRKVIVSNNGSVLDQETFSSTALLYLMATLNRRLPKMAVLSLETRPEYVEFAELEFLARALGEGDTPTNLELAIGFEAFDDHIRNQVFDKGLSLDVFEDFLRTAAPFGYQIKTYFMQKPVPRMSDAEAVQDIQHAIDYLHEMARQYGIRINMHLNPTYAARGTRLEDAFLKKEYVPPLLTDVARAARHADGKTLSIFIGLSDEGLAVEGGSFLRAGDRPLLEQLERFNRTQDYSILKAIEPYL